MRRVLIVDDDCEMCEELSVVLCDEGFTTETATDGGQALALVGLKTYDLVLLDLKLPTVEGLEILRRAKGALLAPKVIIVTGSSLALTEESDAELDMASKIEIRRLADGIVTKPFSIDELLDKIGPI